jgi:Flp pilus assembly protein TadG
LARRFWNGRGGNVAIIFGLAFLPMMMMLGATVDYSRATITKSRLQQAIDAAVLAGGVDQTASRDATALRVFTTNLGSQYGSQYSGATATFSVEANGNYSGAASASVPTAFMKIAHVDTIAVGAKAMTALAQVPVNGNTKCIIALNLSATKAIDDSASSAMNAPKCIVQVNSNNATAVNLSGSAKINSAENCIVGGVKTSGTAAMNPARDAVCGAMADPFASMALPSVGPCDHTNYTPTNNETLQPGVYCGGLSISSVNVTFAPGLYIIKGGLLKPSGGSTMTGNGVSFFLTGNGAGVSTSGGSSWHIKAMSTGYLAGFVFFLDPNAVPAKSSTLSGTSELYFEGVLYFARQELNLSGGSAAKPTAPFTAYIADTYTLSGSSNLNIYSDPTQTSLPIPKALLTGGSGANLRLAQ